MYVSDGLGESVCGSDGACFVLCNASTRLFTFTFVCALLSDSSHVHMIRGCGSVAFMSMCGCRGGLLPFAIFMYEGRGLLMVHCVCFC